MFEKMLAIIFINIIAILHILSASSFTVINNFSRTLRGPKTFLGSISKMEQSTRTDVNTALFASTTSEEIIPKEVLFGNPKYASPMLSPDGKYLAFLAPSVDKGVLNIWVKKTLDEDLDQARMITNDSSRGIRQAKWAPDSETMLYLQDFEGDENFHLWAINATSEDVARDLTPGKDVKVSNLMTNKRFKNELLVATNERDATCFDMYRVNYKTSEITMDTQNPGDVIGWGSEDETFQIRQAVVKSQADSSTTVRIRDSSDDSWRDLITFPYGEEGNLVEFGKDGKIGYMTSSLGRETTALQKVDLQTGEVLEVISYNDKCDCGGIIIDDDTKEIQAVGYNYARRERIFFDKELEEDYKVLESLGGENKEVGVVSKTEDKQTWIAEYTRSDGPTEYVIYDRATKQSTPLFVSRPELLKYKFAPMEDVRIQARDGLELVGYLTRASTTDKTPLILLVHGGPWARDFWGFNAAAQWFANRGYATLQVNYRASTGYGKSFLHKGDEEWGVGTMQHDLTDSVQWAIEEGIADPDNICIYGGSYGGYACLAGLAFTPDLYKCGVDIVGPSNIKTLLDSIPPYWGPLRNDMIKKIGNVDEDVAFNEKISPFYHVDNIKAPLLIGQGANDPRVKQAESDQIAFTMKRKNIPVEYVLYPDEGHGFARPQNRIDFNARAELFLQTHLGGRAEEFVKMEGATATLPLEQDVAMAK